MENLTGLFTGKTFKTHFAVKTCQVSILLK